MDQEEEEEEGKEDEDEEWGSEGVVVGEVLSGHG
jgi:hypothetical protein